MSTATARSGPGALSRSPAPSTTAPRLAVPRLAVPRPTAPRPTAARLAAPLLVALSLASCASERADPTGLPDPVDPDLALPRGYLAPRATVPPQIDGLLDDPAWESAAWTADFADIQGDLEPAPRLRTHAKMLWDDEYLYVGAWLEEPNVWGTLTEHDSIIFHDPDFEVFLDPDGDRHQYYEIEINALGTVWDLRLVKPYLDGGPPVDTWEIPGLRAATFVDGTLNQPQDVDHGWSVELAFPWSALGEFATVPCPPRPGDQWRIAFSRVEWQVTVEDGVTRKVPDTAEDNWTWTPQGVVNMHLPEHWGFVQFCEVADPATGYRPDPAQRPREILCEVHSAQREYYELHGSYASSLGQLGLELPANYAAALRIECKDGGYEASLATLDREGHTAVLRIRHDGKLHLERVRL